MTLEELKIRQLTNQYLIHPADMTTVVHGLCGIQAQFMANALHSLKIRCTDYEETAVKEKLVKNWTIRGTVHIFAEDDLPLFLHCNDGKDYHRNEWHGYTFWNQREKWALTPERQQYFSDVILASLKEGPHTRDELKLICRENGMTQPEEDSMFDSWGGGVRELCERGFLNYVVQEKKAYCLSPGFAPIPEKDAMLEMARRYFTNIAPATIHDAMYFFHTTAAQVKQWLAALPVTAAECNGRTYYYIENGKTYAHGVPKCLFLAGFDQLMLGYEKKESVYLNPKDMRGIFNLAGIVMPALLLDGKVAGRWKKQGRKLQIALFGNVSPNDVSAITDKAEALWGSLLSIDIELFPRPGKSSL